MVWTAPMTAVAGAVFTAAQFNLYVRDNLNETAVAKATTAGGYFVATGANALEQRLIESDTVATQEATSSTSYTDLATVGPSVTSDTGTSALVFVTCMIASPTVGSPLFADFAITGETSRAASDTTCLRFEQDSNDFCRATAVTHVTGLNPGINTFTMKYRSDSGTSGNFRDRHLIIQPY